MSIKLIDEIQPQNNGDFPIVQDTFIKGGYRTVADLTARDAIPALRRAEGMTVYVVSVATAYKLISGITNSNWQIENIIYTVIQAIGGGDDLAIADGIAYFSIPEKLNGKNLISCHARVVTAGTTNTTDIQIHNVTDNVDMLSTLLTINSGETGSETATPYIIDTTHDDVAIYDLLRIDVKAISTTAPKGLIVMLGFA